MENKSKPKLCDILGVELGEWFMLKSVDPLLYWNKTRCRLIPKIGDDSVALLVDSDCKLVDPLCLSLAIQYPDEMIIRQSFTDQEIDDARQLNRLFLADTISRTDVLKCMDDFGHEALMDWELFPSIKQGESFKISEIIGED